MNLELDPKEHKQKRRLKGTSEFSFKLSYTLSWFSPIIL